MVLYLLQEGFCNIRCRHCYLVFQKDKVKRRDVHAAAGDVANLQSHGYHVHLRGTEILLNPEYLSLFTLVQQDYIQTNGILLRQDPSLLARLRDANVTKILLSYPIGPEDILGIPAEIAEAVTPTASGQGFRVALNVIVTKGVVNCFREDGMYFQRLCDRLIDLGAGELRFVRLIPFSHDLKAISPSPSETKVILTESARLEAHYKDRFDITRAGQMGCFDLRRTLKEDYLGVKVPPPEQSDVMDCPAGAKLFVIDLDNDVYPCLYSMDRSHRIGRFADGDIMCDRNAPVPAQLHATDCPAYMRQYHQTFAA